MTYNIAIIGCGRISGHHCRSIIKVDHCNLTAVCDLDIVKAKKYGDEFSVPSYANYNEMLIKHPDIDVVVIATPSGMHYHHAYEIITNYKKHIIVEKPTFLKLTHFHEINDLADKNNLKIFPVFQNRYNKAVQRVKLALNSKELGALRLSSVRVRWCRTDLYYSLSQWRGTYAMDGGALTNQGVHHIDLLRYLCGEVQMVSAQMKTLGANIEVEDSIVAQLTFKSGAIGTIEITTAARPDNYEASLSLVCSEGLAQIGGIAVNELQIFTPNQSDCSKFSEDFSGCVYGEGHVEFYMDIISDLKNATKRSIDKSDNLGTLELLHAIYLSSEKNGEVVYLGSGKESSLLGRPNESLFNLYKTKSIENII